MISYFVGGLSSQPSPFPLPKSCHRSERVTAS
jgi:hypothetical protein